MLEELKEDFVNGDGTIDEIAGVKSITFYDSWNEIILLEVLAENIEYDEFISYYNEGDEKFENRELTL